MWSLVALALTLAGQAGAPVQQIATPPSGGISPLAWTIITTLVTALVAVSKFAHKMYGDLKESRAALARAEEDHVATLKVFRNQIEKP
ncbi:MAG: hypothetical protein ACREI9_07715 [Nitrospiraceae bacterium]